VTEDLRWSQPPLDMSVAHPARMYNYWLGGGHNFGVDRELAEKVMRVFPGIEDVARIIQAFLRRAVLFMVDSGIRQFVDIGSSLPNVGMVHEIVEQNAGCRVVYVDSDPVAAAYGESLLKGADWAAVVRADLRDLDGVFGSAEVGELIDLDRPLGLIAPILHFLRDRWKPAAIVAGYRDRLASGSYLVLTHVTADGDPSGLAELEQTYRRTRFPVHPRSRDEILRLCAGFDLVEPGLVHLPDWRPDGLGDRSIREDVNGLLYGAVGRRP
jgi:hypothetical protein